MSRVRVPGRRRVACVTAGIVGVGGVGARRSDRGRIQHDGHVLERAVLLHLPVGERAGGACSARPLQRDDTRAERGYQREQRDGEHHHRDGELDQAEALLTTEGPGRAYPQRGAHRRAYAAWGAVETSCSVYRFPSAVFSSVVGFPTVSTNVLPPVFSEPPAIETVALPDWIPASVNVGSAFGKSALLETVSVLPFTVIRTVPAPVFVFVVVGVTLKVEGWDAPAVDAPDADVPLAGAVPVPVDVFAAVPALAVVLVVDAAGVLVTCAANGSLLEKRSN